jgi:hypothetical protein
MIQIYIATAIGGFATIVPQSQFAPFFQTELKKEEFSAGQAMFNFGTTGGACLFLAITGAMLNAGANYNHVFLLATTSCVAALLIGFVGLRFPKEDSAGERSV